MPNPIRIILLFLLILTGLILEARADTIHLKNGRKMEGLIKREVEDGVWLDLGFGAVKLRWEEIEGIDRSDHIEAESIRQEWQRREKLEQETREKKGLGPKEIRFSEEGGHIFVDALLNNQVKATLLLDTGAPMTLLSGRMTKELGIKTQDVKIETMKVLGIPDLHVVSTVLDSIKIEGAEARDVDVGASIDETPQIMKDGLLGMSFLRRFNFQIDSINKKLILEKKKTQNIPQKTKYFSVIAPSDWEGWVEEERLIIRGPNLTVKKGLTNPHIMIARYAPEDTDVYMKSVKEFYDYWKDSPGLKHKMSEGLEKSFKQGHLQDRYEFISSRFEEKRDFIMLYVIFIDKEDDIKNYEVDVITKAEPVKTYNLRFLCAKGHFDKYFPVFKKCLESFKIIE